MLIILLAVGAILVLYGLNGIRNRRISWRRGATRTDKIMGRAGLMQSHVETEYEGPAAVLVGAAVAGAGVVLVVWTLARWLA